MPKSSASLANDLASKIRSLEGTRRKIVSLKNRGLISEQAFFHFYEGLFLNSHVLFEVFIEELFIGLLVNGKGLISSRRDIVPRVSINSHKVARELIFGPTRSYADWLPYDKTIKLANIYFRGGRPFTDLPRQMISNLYICHVIRNAIAHKSRSSLRQFNDVCIGNVPLPPKERTPAGYLCGFFRITPAQTRYENIVIELLNISRKLAE